MRYLCAAALLLTALALPASAAPLYRVTDLHVAGGFELTNDGTVYVKTVGADQRTPTYSTIRAGRTSPLNFPTGATVLDVSDRGTLLGETVSRRDFVQTTGGSRRYLNTAAGANNTAAYAVNDAGVAVGIANYNHVGSLVLWPGATPVLPHVAVSGVWAINKSGTVAVTNQTGTKVTVGTVTQGQITHLPTSAARPIDFGTDISTAGTVVGIGFDAGLKTVHGLVWKGGVMRDTGVLAGDTSSGLNAINDAGVAVGASTGGGISHAVLWDGRALVNLNTLVTGAAGVKLVEALEINADGQILVRGKIGGKLDTFLLTPQTHAATTATASEVAAVPEPAAAFSLVSLALLALRRRRGA